MFIERDLTITHSGLQDSLDVHPRADPCCEPPVFEGHAFFMSVDAAGFTYKICGRCGTVRIIEKHS